MDRGSQDMPHVVVKLWPGKTERQKRDLADAMTGAVTSILGYGEEAVSVAMFEVDPAAWTDEVYTPDIVGQADRLLKRPGYGPAKGSH